MKIFKKILTVIGIFISFQIVIRLLRRYFKFPAPPIIHTFLDSNLRRKLQPPELIISRSGIQPGMQVLEVGCGSGAFTPHIAHAVGDHGRVFALDIQPEMLQMLKEKLNRPENAGLHNIIPVNESAYHMPFETGSLDLVYMVAVFQEIPDKHKTLKEIYRVLRPGGYLSISELLPDPDYPWMSTTIRMGLKGGFIVDRLEGNLWNYTIRFKKEKANA
jgi:ubiquinone/menaquinone biosynthesis C-methylase UbiE